MYLRRDDLPMVACVTALYFALAGLCLWGAIAWDSFFMLCFAGLWAWVGLTFLLYVTFVPPRMDDDEL